MHAANRRPSATVDWGTAMKTWLPATISSGDARHPVPDEPADPGPTVRRRFGIRWAWVRRFLAGMQVYGLVQVSAGEDDVPLAMKPNVVDPDAGTAPL